MPFSLPTPLGKQTAFAEKASLLTQPKAHVTHAQKTTTKVSWQKHLIDRDVILFTY